MTKLSQLKIDPEFQNQINPPSFEETHQLEMNILKEERVLNPIITWNGYIVDGHDCAETSSMIAQKCTPNQRNKSNLKDSHLIRTTDAHLTFGEYQNVFLTAKEYRRLKADFSGLDDLIEQLSAYIQSTGKKYTDHAATLRIWAKRQKTERKSTPGIPDYTFKEGENL